METTDHRQTVSQLAEDLGWLEEHSRRQPEMAPLSGQLRLAAALVRNVVGPFLNNQPPEPLHIAVVGGAGTGKSTIVNFLTGVAAAESNPQAGFTRHPVAYVAGNAPLHWPSHLGFLGPLHRLAKPGPSSLDEDVYQVRRVQESGFGEEDGESPRAAARGLDGETSSPNPEPPTPNPGAAPNPSSGFGPLGDVVVWDCPDMTTWAASNYVPRLLEIAGLADVIVYVASDERYNDEVPTQFLHLLVKAGKPVVVVLTKMREADAPALIGHFQHEVLGRLPRDPSGHAPSVPVLAVPFLTAEQLADPVKNAGRYRIPLLNQVAVLLDPPRAARQRTVRNALRYLGNASEQLLEVARLDLAALDSWRSLVQTGQVEFDTRYRREYLTGEKFRRFDEARQRMLDLLDLPGAGRVVSGILWLVRTPYRLLRGYLGKALARPEAVNLPEREVLDGALRAWLDQLRTEAIRRAPTHPLWKHLANGFESGLADNARDRFEEDYRRFQLGLADETEANARSLYAGLEQNPALLNTLRGLKIALDAVAVGLGLWVGVAQKSVVWSLVLIPIFASITHQGFELAVGSHVEKKRQALRMQQQMMMSQYISAPLAEWLAQWPTTGGSAYERLQRALRRVPQMIQELADAAEAKMAHAPAEKVAT